jgi:hypothetical protein
MRNGSLSARKGFRVALLLAGAAGLAAITGEATPWPYQFVRWEFLDASTQIEHPTAHNGFRSATEGDLDNDGDLDVVVVQNFTSAGVVGTPAPSVLYINEGGRFVDRTAELLPELLVPQVTWWSNIHDFDSPADGWQDIFVPGGDGEPSRLFKNLGVDGDGDHLGFQDVSGRIDGPLAQETFSYHSHKADFDGDGAMDMFVYQYRTDLDTATNKRGQNRILMNRGGILVDETAARLPIRSEPGIFGHCEDLNGDGWVDISQVNLKNGLVPGPIPQLPSTPSIRVLINDGTGHFPTSLEQPMPERLNPTSSLGTYSLEHADLNGDGWLDIYVINWGMPGNEARDAVLVNSRHQAQLFSTVYYPELPNGTGVDSDGDHPLSRDLNGDGRLDVVTAQFSTRPYVLMNETVNGVLRLVERTPPEVPTSVSGFRTKLFDANGDGAFDIWLALRTRNFLNVTLKAEAEPNDSPNAPNAITSYPALRTGILGGPRPTPVRARRGGEAADADGGEPGELVRDRDYFRLPARAILEGARVRLRPSPDSDLSLTVLDANGLVVGVSQVNGNGAIEQVVLTPGSAASVVLVDRQSATGGGNYRLEVTSVTGLQVAPEPPLELTERAKRAASSTGDACHPKRQPPPRVRYSNP